MYLGVIVEKAPTAELFANPLHPYTKGLLSAVPEPDPDFEQGRERIHMSGEVPSPINPQPGCRFAKRCPYATERCMKETPELRQVGSRQIACHLDVKA